MMNLAPPLAEAWAELRRPSWDSSPFRSLAHSLTHSLSPSLSGLPPLSREGGAKGGREEQGGRASAPQIENLPGE